MEIFLRPLATRPGIDSNYHVVRHFLGIILDDNPGFF